MARFLDVHPTGGVNEDTLKKMQNELPDEFGVTTENIMYNIEDDKVFCLIEAPDKNAVEKHHAKYGIKCEWIVEVKTTSSKRTG
ncbi:MAG: nickel-binding protein [Nitrososphaeraceae archaeon]